MEAPTVDIISSSLNGLSLSVFSGSGLPDLGIFQILKSIFLKVNQPVGSKNVLQVAQKGSEARRAKNRRAEAYSISTLERGDQAQRRI